MKDYIKIIVDSDLVNLYRHMCDWTLTAHTNHLMHSIAYHMIMEGGY